MYLVTMAHKGEAVAILNRLNLKKDSLADHTYYHNEQLYLFFTGEGIEEINALSLFLGAKLAEISTMINLGFAGSLTTRLLPGQIVSVKTIYGQKPGSLEENPRLFKKSYPCDNPGIDDIPSYDLITATTRVEITSLNDQLSLFAQIVDREAYAAAKLAQLVKVPFQCFKVVSDFANETTNLDTVRSQSKELSESLLNVLQTILEIKEEKRKPDKGPLPEGLHFSASQEKLFFQLIEKLKIKLTKTKSEILSQAGLESITQEPLKSKERTRKLLENLQFLLNPRLGLLQQKLRLLSENFNRANQQISYHPQFENDTLSIHATIHNSVEWQSFLKASQELDYDKIVALLNGLSQ